MNESEKEHLLFLQEDAVREKIDANGIKWTKVYFGGGVHFQNWLEQVLELRGKENIELEEVKSLGLRCFQDGDEKTYRIWVKESNSPINVT